MALSKECLDVLEIYRHTGSWVGEEITNLDQRNWLGDTPLHTVCTNGDLKSAEILILNGADVNALGDQNSTPLFNAIMSKNIKLIQYLISKGADVSKKNDWGRLPLEYAKNTKSPAEIIQLLEKSTSKSKGKKKK